MVRIVQSESLHADKSGALILLKESYAELRDEGQDVEFMIFYSNESPAVLPVSNTIRPLPKVEWRGAQAV